MTTQIEHLENHTARLKVEVPPAKVEKAMQDAARRISRKVNIPGFRKGKAPYNLILKYVGAEALLEEAIEEISQELYREALDEAKIEPYAPGALENIESEPTVTLTFVVAKQPEADLGNYRDVRLPFEAPTVEDEAVTEAIKRVQEQRAVIEPALRPVQLGDLVKFKVYGEVEPLIADQQLSTESEAVTEKEAEPEDVENAVDKDILDNLEEDIDDEDDDSAVFIDEELEEVITDDKEEDLVPGFFIQLVGMSAGESKEFAITLPEDYSNKDFAGKTISFEVDVKEVKSRTLPVINDEFAKEVSDGENDNLLDFRIHVRKDLQDAATREAEMAYSEKMLDKILEQATLKYPEVMAEQYTDDILKTLDRNLRERGLSLDDYKRIENKDDAGLRAMYRDTAIKRLSRTLVLTEFIKREHISVSEDTVNTRIQVMSAQFGDQVATFRDYLTRPENKQNIALDLLTESAYTRLLAIGKGENPTITSLPTEEKIEEKTEEKAEEKTEQSAMLSSAASTLSEPVTPEDTAPSESKIPEAAEPHSEQAPTAE